MADPNVMTVSDDERAALECWRRQTGRSHESGAQPRLTVNNPVVVRLDLMNVMLREIRDELQTLQRLILGAS